MGDLDEVFERWEVRVAEAEIEGGLDDPAVSVDAFADGFHDEEQDADLRAELERLRSEPDGALSAATGPADPSAADEEASDDDR